MNTCRCPNDPHCGIDHVAIAQENATLREALIACPKFRYDAIAEVDCDLIVEASTPEAMWMAMVKTCDRYIAYTIARTHFRTETQVLDDECRDYRVGPYAARKVAA
jgi:hypothetical protein